jgi:glucose-6-phosphate 1-dehydrogenase
VGQPQAARVELGAPLLDHPPDVRPYPRGSWGPEEAETLLRGHPRWQQPWLPEEG